jgi:hypothetical protein
LNNVLIDLEDSFLEIDYLEREIKKRSQIAELKGQDPKHANLGIELMQYKARLDSLYERSDQIISRYNR